MSTVVGVSPLFDRRRLPPSTAVEVVQTGGPGDEVGRIDVEGFPVGTLTVDVVGTFALGLFSFHGVGPDPTLFFGVGACGSFTTFSSVPFQTVRLWETGDRSRAAVDAFGALAPSWLAIGLGLVVVPF